MAAMKSIITPIEKNPDGTVKQKAIITGAIPKNSKQFNRIPALTTRKPVTYVTTPQKRRSNLTPVRAQQPTAKLRSGLTPIKFKQQADMKKQKGCLQRAGIFPLRPIKKVTIQDDSGNNKGVNSTFEVPNIKPPPLQGQAVQKKPSATSLQSATSKSSVALKPNKSKIPRVAVTYATARRRRSSVLGAGLSCTPSEKKKLKSKIPVPVNPVTVPQHIQPEVSTVYLMKKEKDLVEEITLKQKELASVREMLRKRLDAKYDATPQQAHESPAAAYNLRRPSLSLKKADMLRLEMDFSPITGIASPDNLPADVLLSHSKPKTPRSIFENYRRNCAALKSPSTVIRKRRSRSLSIHRAETETSISERVLLQLKNLYA